MLLMIFLAEYLHLVIASVHFVLFFAGGWYGLELFWFLPPIFLNFHETLIETPLYLQLLS
jgi:NADH:ubiquinone oxidoreductase subunit H